MAVYYDQDRLDAAATRLGLHLVVAFGSRISGDPPPTERSDLDVAVLDGEPYTWSRFTDVYGALANVFSDCELDLAFLNHADPLFRFQIFRTAERLYGDTQLFCAQQCYAHKSYVDSKDLRDLERILFERKLQYIDDQMNG